MLRGEIYIMTKVSRRGFCEDDKRWFSNKEIIRLKKAQGEIRYLIDRDYKMPSVITFVGDRYQFSIRQRDALKRATCTSDKCLYRKNKVLSIDKIKDGPIYIDGFNLIITIEVALSKGTLIFCDDDNIRDIAGLRGTYKIIDKTDAALDIIGKFLEDVISKDVVIYLDSPVSNSGNLKSKIMNYAKNWNFNTYVELVNNSDVILEKLDRVVSSDSVIIDKCISYFNLNKSIINQYIKSAELINLSET